MLLERIYDDGLAQASYLIGCQATGTAVVVDPNREIERYLEAAQRAKMRIAFVTETHIHADFLSGARELAQTAGAELLLSAEGGRDWQYRFAEAEGARLLRHGDRFEVGQVRVEVVRTPGHTPEHICFLVTDAASGSRPIGLLSGDFLFVGDVGRPDLLERAAQVEGTMDVLARQLFRSVRATASLPDYLQIWPGHGAGSACGKALGALPSTTLGYERLVNWAFQIEDEDRFVAEATAGQPEPPRYFARMKAVNRDGPPLVPRRELAELGLDDVRESLAAGDPVIDVRSTADFAAGHIPGTLNLPIGTSFATWAGSLLPYDRAITILADDHGRVSRARMALQSIGLDGAIGWAGKAVREAWASTVSSLQSVPQVDVRQLASGNGRTIVDVRGATEWDHGHVPGARHLFLGDLVELTRDLPRDTPLALHCQGGTRSAIASSLLQAQGFTDIANVSGGLDAWVKAGLPVESSDH